jgi:hypothetical protein
MPIQYTKGYLNIPLCILCMLNLLQVLADAACFQEKIPTGYKTQQKNTIN